MHYRDWLRSDGVEQLQIPDPLLPQNGASPVGASMPPRRGV